MKLTTISNELHK